MAINLGIVSPFVRLQIIQKRIPPTQRNAATISARISVTGRRRRTPRRSAGCLVLESSPSWSSAFSLTRKSFDCGVRFRACCCSRKCSTSSRAAQPLREDHAAVPRAKTASDALCQDARPTHFDLLRAINALIFVAIHSSSPKFSRLAAPSSPNCDSGGQEDC